MIELGIVLWVLLGWRFALANILLGLLMVLYAYALTALWFPSELADEERRHAEQAQKKEGMDMEPDSRGSWRDTLASRDGWRRIAQAFIGSMGNVPPAAMLWSKQMSFGGVMSFLGADLVAPTVVWIHATHYGWRKAGHLSVVMYLCMVAAGITVHYLYALTGLMPTERPSLQEMVRFAIGHTFILNLAFGALAVSLFRLHSSGGHGRHGHDHAHHAHGRA